MAAGQSLPRPEIRSLTRQHTLHSQHPYPKKMLTNTSRIVIFTLQDQATAEASQTSENSKILSEIASHEDADESSGN